MKKLHSILYSPRNFIKRASIKALTPDRELLVRSQGSEKYVHAFSKHSRAFGATLSICLFAGFFGIFLSFFASDILPGPALKSLQSLGSLPFPAVGASIIILFLLIGARLGFQERVVLYQYRNVAIATCALCVQNLLIFKKHYFNGYGFPWDFLQAYYASTAFWISTLRNGIVPAWVPFQQIGYPIDLNLQIGIHYPLFWIFPLLKITYTLNQAAKFQSLHVLLGSLGMFCLSRTKYPKISYALLGAVAFQFFGGFYSNSQHADIVRAYALIPWLLYSFTLDVKAQSPLRGRNILISPIILLLATGGYPGNFIAGLLACAFYVAMQLFIFQRNTKSAQKTITTGLWLLAFAALGLGMASFHLAPGFVEREYLARYQNLNALAPMGLDIAHLPGLFLTNRCLPGEITMASTFVTLPVIILTFFISWSCLKSSVEIFALGIFSVLLGGGPNSPVWLLLVKLIPQVGYSRFPVGDYKIFLAISIILLSLGGLSSVVEDKNSLGAKALKTGIAMLFFQISLIMALTNVFGDTFHAPLDKKDAVKATLVFVSTVGLIWFYLLNDLFSSKLLIASIGLLVLVNGVNVIHKIVAWKVPRVNKVYSTVYEFPLTAGNGEFIPDIAFSRSPSVRPARMLGEGTKNFSWKGYISGQYFLDDKAPNLLSSSDSALSNPIYREYMKLPWTPVLFSELDANADPAHVSIPDQHLEKEMLSYLRVDTPVKQSKYGINEIAYDVDLSSSKLLIENEIYFPGWQAVLRGESGNHFIRAVPVNHVFRGWLLPAGRYEMVARFTFPNHHLYLSTSGLATLLWVIASLFFISAVSKDMVGWRWTIR